MRKYIILQAIVCMNLGLPDFNLSDTAYLKRR